MAGPARLPMLPGASGCTTSAAAVIATKRNPPAPASRRGGRAWMIRVSRKPNSVGLLRGDHSSGAPVSGRLGATDPGVLAERDTLLPLYSVLLQVGFTEPAPSPGPLVRSYRTVSPLPATRLRASAGGLLSVALSVGSRPLGVTQHPALWSSDFPRAVASAAACAAAWAPPAITWETRYPGLCRAPRSPAGRRARCRRGPPIGRPLR